MYMRAGRFARNRRAERVVRNILRFEIFSQPNAFGRVRSYRHIDSSGMVETHGAMHRGRPFCADRQRFVEFLLERERNVLDIFGVQQIPPVTCSSALPGAGSGILLSSRAISTICDTNAARPSACSKACLRLAILSRDRRSGDARRRPASTSLRPCSTLASVRATRRCAAASMEDACSSVRSPYRVWSRIASSEASSTASCASELPRREEDHRQPGGAPVPDADGLALNPGESAAQAKTAARKRSHMNLSLL